MEYLYLDDNATKRFSPRVEKYVKEEFINDYANASSEHDAGFELSNKIKLHRKVIADHIGSSTKKIIFTSGATESINNVLSIDNLNRLKINTLISSPMEHHATLNQLEYLSSYGFKVHFVTNNDQGVLNLDHLEQLCKQSPGSMISLMYVNNETGVINDVKKITEIGHQNKCHVHIDAVQALGKLSVDLDDINCDFASFSGHKIGSFKGIGLLYVQNIDQFLPLLHGGGQERGYRPGTYNYPAIKSFALAIEDIDFKALSEYEKCRLMLENEFKKINPNFGVNCEHSPRVANTLNLYFADLDARELLLKLSRAGIYVSTGSACNGANPEPSHVLKAIRPVNSIDSLRLSCNFNSEIVEKFITSIKSILTT